MSMSLFNSETFYLYLLVYLYIIYACIIEDATFLLRIWHSFGKVACHIHCAFLKKYGVLYNPCGKGNP